VEIFHHHHQQQQQQQQQRNHLLFDNQLNNFLIQTQEGLAKDKQNETHK